MLHYRSRSLTRAGLPATEPLTLAEAKLHLRVDGSDEDNLITDLIVAARFAAEEYLKRSLITQSWKLVFDDYTAEETHLPRGPVVSVTSVKSIARDGTQTTLDSDGYYLNAAKDRLVFTSIVIAHQVEIVYATGYGDATAIPKAIKQGMLAHIASMYDAREAGGALPPGAVALYQPFREVSL